MTERYEVTLRDMRTGNRRSFMFSATSFSHVEEMITDTDLTHPYFDPGNEEIISIDKDYATDEEGGE